VEVGVTTFWFDPYKGFTLAQLKQRARELVRLVDKLEQENRQLKAKVDEYREKAWMYDSLCK
jgi:hypothetical protein